MARLVVARLVFARWGMAWGAAFLGFASWGTGAWLAAQESPRLPADRPTQAEIEVGRVSIKKLQVAGLRMFTTPFNRLDGYGDGPLDPADTRLPGGRPTLQGNGTFLRVNGLDAQTCLECHSIVSNATVPAVLGIGGVGGSNSNAIIQPTAIDAADGDRDAEAGFDGRFANPPFVFGAGAVELLAKEMTADLIALREQALASPDTPVELVSKGVRFGTLVYRTETGYDHSQVEGVSTDLVVRPFGRKGEFATIREFDVGALQFHFGMQPTEAPGVGVGVDADGDGVVNEITPGDLSALTVFIATLEAPRMEKLSKAARAGGALFDSVGCAECHIPSLETTRATLPLAFPEVPGNALANVYVEIPLNKKPGRFKRNDEGGITVPLFADLKRHDLGPGLAESFSLASESVNREYTTARLWGVADTAPYLHDGRATTLTDAILEHAGEAQDARDAFDALTPDEQGELLAFLRSLRTPRKPAKAVERALRRSR